MTRLKTNAKYAEFGNRKKPDSPAVKEDFKIKLKGEQTDFRLIQYTDPETGIEYKFLTNSLKITASEVAALYKERWQIELFFKWIKQNLKVKTFLGTSINAVLTQVWIALCVYLLLSFLKFRAKLAISLTVILRVLQMNLFDRRLLSDILKPPDKRQTPVSTQILMWN